MDKIRPNAAIEYSAGCDGSHLFYVAFLFDYADDWTLDEPHENIREKIYGGYYETRSCD